MKTSRAASLLSALLLAGCDCAAERLPGARLEGRTDKDALSYKVGEEIVFELRLEGLSGKAPEGCKVKWEMADDDGRQSTGEAELPVDGPLVLRDRLQKPGFVKLFAHVVDAKGRKHDLYAPWRQRASRLWWQMRPVRRYILAIYRRLL